MSANLRTLKNLLRALPGLPGSAVSLTGFGLTQNPQHNTVTVLVSVSPALLLWFPGGLRFYFPVTLSDFAHYRGHSVREGRGTLLLHLALTV